MTEVIAYAPKDAAAALGVGLTTIYGLIGSGALRAKKCGNRTLITASSIRAHLDSLPDAEITTGQPAPAGQPPRKRGLQRRAA